MKTENVSDRSNNISVSIGQQNVMDRYGTNQKVIRYKGNIVFVCKHYSKNFFLETMLYFKNVVIEFRSQQVYRLIGFFWNFTWSYRVSRIKNWRCQVFQKSSHFWEKPKHSSKISFFAFFQNFDPLMCLFLPKNGV